MTRGEASGRRALERLPERPRSGRACGDPARAGLIGRSAEGAQAQDRTLALHNSETDRNDRRTLHGPPTRWAYRGFDIVLSCSESVDSALADVCAVT